MEKWIEQLMGEWGYFGVAFLVALENLFPPIPSELILTFGGFMTTHSTMTIPGVIIASSIGSLVGAIVLYSIGKLVQLERLKRLISGRLGKLVRLKPKDIDSAGNWFQTHGFITVFLCRFIPVVRSLISIPAGIARMPMLTFVHYTALGIVIWNTVLILLGAWAGENWTMILMLFEQYKYYLFIPFGVIVVYLLIRFYQGKKRYV